MAHSDPWRWSPLLEAQWLGLLPGWDRERWGPPLDPSRRPGYERGLRQRVTDFTGEGELEAAVREAFLAALLRPAAAPAILGPIVGRYGG